MIETDVRPGAVKVEFKDCKQAVQRRFNDLKTKVLFNVQIDKDEIWALYLASFPEGSNPIFRERTEHNCSCCRSFIKNAGGMVAIENGQLSSLWDLQVGGEYQSVVDALADYVKAKAIDNVFLHTESSIGTDMNREDLGERIITWEHFHIALPKPLTCGEQERGPKEAEFRAMHDVLLRSLQEIAPDAIETVQDLISQNSLYRGAEKKAMVDAFAVLKRQFDTMPESSRDPFAWAEVVGPNAFVCRIRNDVIGTLLVDLSEGVELEKAVKSFEDKVSGTNYKRPTALVTPRMRDNAKQTLTELGLLAALDRRYAKLEDVKVSNVLFADRNAKKRMAADVFDQIVTKGESSKNLERVEEIPIDWFISDVLPTATTLEVLFENRQAGNLVSLIAPYDLTAKGMFKWANPFSWTYSGDVADSIKERVKQAGGNVTGDVCCRLAWYNTDDLDFHMQEPNGNHIYYGNKGSGLAGKLDVDMNVSRLVRDPVENIFYPTLRQMQKGNYMLSVHQFTKRETTDVGFDVEIDVLGTVYRFAYPCQIPANKTVNVAQLKVTDQGVEIIPLIEASQATREVWGIKTQSFQPVTAMMLSPNFWDGNGIGNKHFFFMLDGCRNDGSARGFYNEFLSSELEPHRKTMEIVGSKMRTEECADQMSGLGFSSTQRNSLICKVHGSFVRTVKITF